MQAMAMRCHAMRHAYPKGAQAHLWVGRGTSWGKCSRSAWHGANSILSTVTAAPCFLVVLMHQHCG